MSPEDKIARKRRGRDYTVTCIATIVIASSFLGIYQAAQKAQPGNAIWAGISLFAGSFLLGTQLSQMRNRLS